MKDSKVNPLLLNDKFVLFFKSMVTDSTILIVGSHLPMRTFGSLFVVSTAGPGFRKHFTLFKGCISQGYTFQTVYGIQKATYNFQMVWEGCKSGPRTTPPEEVV